MGFTLAFLTLLASSPLGSGPALKGPEAYQQLQQFEADYNTQLKTSGKRVPLGERQKAFKQKADDLLAGVSVKDVPAQEGLAWAKVLDVADRTEEALPLLDKFIATKPADTDLLDAQLTEARDFQKLGQVKKSGSLLSGLKPLDEKTAQQLASADSNQARMIGEGNPNSGIQFIDQVSPGFTSYVNAEKLLSSVRKSLTMDITRSTLIGSAAPELPILPDKYGAFTSIGDLKGKVVVLDFFAHWCPPCKASFPAMKTLSDELGDKLQVIGVTAYYGYYGQKKGIDQKEEFGDMKEFMAQFSIDHPVVYVNRTDFASYGVSGIPEFVLIGKDGTVKKVVLGYSAELFKQFREAVATETAK